MKDRDNRCHSRIASLALAGGLGLFAAMGPAAAAPLKADFNDDGYDDLAVGAGAPPDTLMDGA